MDKGESRRRETGGAAWIPSNYTSMPTKKIVDSWLRSLVDYSYSPAEISDRLTYLGIEVESIDDRRLSLVGYVVGEVMTRQAHPNADRLSVCVVGYGADDPVTVVCGAPNVEAGQKIVFAPVGTHVASADFTIERRKIRGVVSEGMICSERELGLGDDHDGILVLPADSIVGTPVTDLLGDVIFEIDVTPNRADALNHLGIARELSAVTGNPIHLPATPITESATATASAISVDIADPDLCPRYVARVIRGVRNAPSPAWLQDALKKLGLRPRNILVDVTSYVLFECGHPLHAFDFDRIAGSRIIVRTSALGENFITLDGRSHILPEGALMICDAEKPVAIAGVMGGENSEISDTTVNVLLESAYFDPSSIRRTARRLGISTDASYRFERGADIAQTIGAIDRAASLIQSLAGGEVLSGYVDVNPSGIPERHLRLRPARTEEVLGIGIDDTTQISCLERLGFRVTSVDDTTISVIVPSWRSDVVEEIDLIEEVARLHGYEHIPDDPRATVSFSLETDRLESLIATSRAFFADNGCAEIVPHYLTDPEAAGAYGNPVLLRNGLGHDFSAMRTSLVPSMAAVIGRNQRHQRRDLRLFEIGTAFRRGRADQGVIPGVVEMTELSLAFAGEAEPTGWGTQERPADLYDMRGVLERYFNRIAAPQISWRAVEEPQWGFGSPALSLFAGENEVGRLGPIHADLVDRHDLVGSPVIAVIDLERLLPHVFTSQIYQAPSKFPTVDRDISLLVDRNVPASLLDAMIRAAGGSLLCDVRLFDLYQGTGIDPARKSMSFNLRFLSHNRTLEVAEIDDAVRSVVDALATGVGAELRGGDDSGQSRANSEQAIEKP